MTLDPATILRLAAEYRASCEASDKLYATKRELLDESIRLDGEIALASDVSEAAFKRLMAAVLTRPDPCTE